MKFKAHALMQGHPEFQVRAKSNPIGFELDAEGSLKLQIGSLTAKIDEIPVTLRIPFLRRGGGMLTVGSIGAFGVHIQPIEAELRPFGVRIGGVLGKDGLECECEGNIGCKTSLDVDGVIPGKVTRVAFDVGEAEEAETEA